VKLLRRIIEATNAKIVLCSSWKANWSRNKEEQNELSNYLDRKLRREELYIYDKTIDQGSNRGEGIIKWLKNKNVESWAVLDDEIFPDYEKYGILKHLVKTSFYGENGGLQPEHVEQAINILNNNK